MIALRCSSYRTIRISLTLFIVTDLFEYHSDDENLYKPNSRMSSFPSDGTNVGWLHKMSWVFFEGITWVEGICF